MRHLASHLVSVVALSVSTIPLHADVIYETEKLLASDGTTFDTFGFSVSIFGNTIVIGAHQDDDNGTDSGSAYVFQRSGTSWEQVAKLLPSDGAEYDHFGESVFISGNTIVVGAEWDDDNGEKSGSAYVYEMPAGGWVGTLHEGAKLLPSDGEAGEKFGESVSISGNTVIVGVRFDDDNGIESGSAYVFVMPAGGWSGTINEGAKLFPSDAEEGHHFGVSVSISGDTIVIGATGDDHACPQFSNCNSGATYTFIKPIGGWIGTLNEDAKLLPSDSEMGDRFGISTSISGDTIVVGSLYGDGNNNNCGSAYVFIKPIGGWSGVLFENAKLLASDGEWHDHFGSPVSFSGNLIVASADGDDYNGDRSGSAYLFDMPVGGWSGTLNEDAKLLASDGAEGDLFAYSVSIYENTIMVGAPADDDSGASAGSVYVFDLNCPADLTGDDQVNIDDIFTVLGLWGDCPDPCPPYCIGDLTEDCTVNIDDIFAILGEWGECE